MTAALHLIDEDADATWYGAILSNQTELFLRRFISLSVRGCFSSSHAGYFTPT